MRVELTTTPRVVADPGDPHEVRIAKLRERLEEVLRDRPLGATRVGVEVMQASDGDVLFAHRADQPFNPASNTKMLTTAAAITFLGSDFRYRTGLYGPSPDADGVVRGDVVLRGSGDPSLTPSDLAEIAHDLNRRGIHEIDGDLFGDPRFHAATESAGVGDGALIVNRNTYLIHVEPGDVGHRAIVHVEPSSPLFAVDAQAMTVHGKRSRLKIDVGRHDGQIVVTVRGRIADNRGDYVESRRLADGALLAAVTLRQALADFDVNLQGDVKIGAPSDAAVMLLGEHQSMALADVCRLSNKPSNNFIAEAIYKTVGGELYGYPGTLEKGTRAVGELMTEAGVPGDHYRIVNGSGLTHENRVRPSDLNQLLRHVSFNLAAGPEFMTSLAVGGIDGTIRSRFQGTEAVGLVRAKTGTLTGVSALSGYVGDKDDQLVFSIFVEGFRHKRLNEIRHAQVRLVQAMLRYLRSDAPPTNVEQVPTLPEPDDSESDGDPML